MRSERELWMVNAAKVAALDYERQMFEEAHGHPDEDLTARTVEALREAQTAYRRAEERLMGVTV